MLFAQQERKHMQRPENFDLTTYVDDQMQAIKKQVGSEKVLLALSGGVDSSVCAALLSKAIPGQLTCIFVDTGLMRLDEGDQVEAAFADKDLNFIRVDAETRFLGKLAGTTDPEAKRKIIGEEFVRIFEEESAKLGDIPYLAQGTIYPDIIESGAAGSANIKSHHNVGGMPEDLAFTGLVEPLSLLYKDEVRQLGATLGLPDYLVNRQPFPGPGLAVRCMGEVTKDKLDALRAADAIVREELDALEPSPAQYFALITNTDSTGIRDEKRAYAPVIAVRAVATNDFMEAEFVQIPWDVLSRISKQITEAVPTISRVVYDITSKPPGTVEWE